LIDRWAGGGYECLGIDLVGTSGILHCVKLLCGAPRQLHVAINRTLLVTLLSRCLENLKSCTWYW